MNNQPRIDYTNKDYDSLREALLALAREKLPAWTDHSPNDLGVLLLELFAYMGDILLYYQDRIANESYLETAVERRSVIHLLRLIGYELRPPRPASADLTLLFKDEPDKPDKQITIAPGTQFRAAPTAGGASIYFQYQRQDALFLILKNLLLIKHTDGKSYRIFQSLPVIQVDTVEPKEILGSSDGSPGQRFALSRSPLIDGHLEVRVDDKQWQRRQSLLYSFSQDEHYVVRRDENQIAWIEFGDGKYGKIPPRGHNNIIASYLTGGGTKGNLSARTITTAVTPIENLKVVYNEKPATGGADAETSAEAVLRGPQLFRAGGRAVTAQDYEAYAKELGVGKVCAWSPSGNQIRLVVAPTGGGLPSDTLKEDLRTYFEDKRIMTCMVEIWDPKYVDVLIKGTLDVEPYFFIEQVRQRVKNAVQQLLAFENVDFGGYLYLSKVYEAIEAIEGVAGITISCFKRSDSLGALPGEGKLVFEANEIPRAGSPEGIELQEKSPGGGGT